MLVAETRRPTYRVCFPSIGCMWMSLTQRVAGKSHLSVFPERRKGFGETASTLQHSVAVCGVSSMF